MATKPKMATATHEAPEATVQTAPNVSRETPISEVLTELQRGVRMYRVFEQAEKAVAALQSLDQLTAERTKAAADAETLTDVARSELKIAQDDLEKVKADAKDLLASAKLKADGLISAATEKAAQIEQESKQRIDAVHEQLAVVTTELLAKTEQLQAVDAQLKALTDKLAAAEEAKRKYLEG